MIKNEWDLLNEAHEALRRVVAGVPEDAWRNATPCEKWDVTQVLQHAAGDQLAYASKLTGGPGPDFDPFNPSGVLGETASEVLEPALAAVAAAFASVAPDAEDVDVPIPPFRLTAEFAVAAASLDAVVHAWDIAVATGQTPPLSPALAARLRPVADALVDPLRGFAFADAIAPSPGADAAESLLNFLGRRAG